MSHCPQIHCVMLLVYSLRLRLKTDSLVELLAGKYPSKICQTSGRNAGGIPLHAYLRSSAMSNGCVVSAFTNLAYLPSVLGLSRITNGSFTMDSSYNFFDRDMFKFRLGLGDLVDPFECTDRVSGEEVRFCDSDATRSRCENEAPMIFWLSKVSDDWSIGDFLSPVSVLSREGACERFWYPSEPNTKSLTCDISCFVRTPKSIELLTLGCWYPFLRIVGITDGGF
ncbi:hypothetical protein OGAPHI_002432 [Ogataea philodendri]|uniref:Uncharacterized protein n=1 Tax=Ogataea philodendri TaxID=1378263 RepID=A0A9P8PAI0_9ASCO|nr:uncharacterized protein OGAPHI_002432 [Ogataea philodendri]KAH3668678.1 hypothetical protein OGAPHI_002432 [Ogataea philodendri]